MRRQVAGLTFAKAVPLARNRPQPGFSPDAVTKIFQADATKLPRYVGAQNERGGFSIYKVENVIDAPAPDAAKLQAAGARVGSEIGRELMTAYIGALKADTEVKINQAMLEKKP